MLCYVYVSARVYNMAFIILSLANCIIGKKNIIQYVFASLYNATQKKCRVQNKT